MKRIGATNPELVNLVKTLKKAARENEASIWADLAERLAKPKRRRAVVNLSKLNSFTDVNDTIVVPGKVLASGKLDHPIKVAAFTFSEQAKLGITRAKGKCLSIVELVKKNPKGSRIKIIG